jgi:hypothetical protein
MSRNLVVLSSLVAGAAGLECTIAGPKGHTGCSGDGSTNLALSATVTGGNGDVQYAWTSTKGGDFSAAVAAPNLNWETIVCGDGDTTVALAIKDADGATATCTAKFSVGKNSAPELQGTGAAGNTSVECGDVPNAAVITASDACHAAHEDSAPAVNLVESQKAVSGNTSELTRTWTTTDLCGNSASHSQTISITDSQKPTLHGVEADKDAACTAENKPCVVTATDACDGDLVVAYDFSLNDMSDACTGVLATHTHTWTATDAAGNFATDKQVVTLRDDEAPTLSGVPSETEVTVDCDAVPSPPQATATDNCAGSVSVSFVATSLTSKSSQHYSEKRVWTASDNCGNDATFTQTVHVEDNEAPILAGVEGDKTIDCEDEVPECKVTATDNCDNSISYNLEAVKSTNPGDCTHSYATVYTWTVADSTGNEATASQTITVQDNEKPVLHGTRSDAGPFACDYIPSAVVTATDNCAGNVVVHETVTDSSGCGNTISRNIEYSASDECGNEATHSWNFSTEDKEKPQLIGLPVSTLSVACDHAPEVPEVTAVDNCGAASLEYSTTGGVDSSKCGNQQETRTWTATDECGNEASFQQVITYSDDAKPEWTKTPAGGTLPCGTSLPDTPPEASDNCGAVTVTGPSVSTPENKGCSDEGSVVLSWTATDLCGKTNSFDQTWTFQDSEAPDCTVVDGAPTIGCSNRDADVGAPSLSCDDDCDTDVETDVTYTSSGDNCAGEFSYTLTGTDNCGKETVKTFSSSWSDGEGPVLGNISPATQEWDGVSDVQWPSVDCTDDCNACTVTPDDALTTDGLCYKVMTNTYYVIDSCGNPGAQGSATATYKDTTTCTLGGVPADSAVDCEGGNVELDAVKAGLTSDCAADEAVFSVTRKFVDTGDCFDTEVITVSVADKCGNDGPKDSFQVRHVDTTPPTLTGVSGNVSLKCGDAPHTPSDATASDNCSEDTWAVTGVQDKDGVVTYTATDACGNVATDSYTVSTEPDTTPPTITVSSCSAVCGIPDACGAPVVDDNCPGEVTYTSTDSEATTPDCQYESCITFTVTATDAAGNEATAQGTRCSSSDGNHGFVGSTPNSTATNECDTDEPDTLTASGPCASSAGVSLAESGTGTATVSRTWSYAGECGASGSTSQVITVTNAAPYFTNGCPGPKTLDCGDAAPAFEDLAVTDDCGHTQTRDETSAPGCGNTEKVTRTWTVTDGVNTPATCQQVLTWIDTQGPTYANGEWTDNCGPVDPEECTTETFYPKKGCTEEHYTVTTCTAYDACGNDSTRSHKSDTVYADPHWLDGPADRSKECTADFESAPATPTSNKQRVVTLTSDADSCNGCTCTRTRTWSSDDNCNPPATWTQKDVRTDSGAPTVTPPSNPGYECNESPSWGAPTAEDVCDGSVSPILTTDTATKKCWTASDACGNQAAEACATAYEIEDTTPPVFGAGPDFNTCYSLPNDAPGSSTRTATDKCGATVTESVTRGSGCEYDVVYNWVAVDPSGNQAVASATACVKDYTPPTLDPTPSDATYYEGSVPAAPVVNVLADGAIVGPAGLAETSLTSATCKYVTQRVWTGTDGCHDVTHTQKICVMAPTPCPGPLSVACDAPVPSADEDTAQFEADAAAAGSTVTFKETTAAGSCNEEYTISRVWTVTAADDSTHTCTQAISINDDNKPVITATLAAKTECGWATPTFSAEDPCAGAVDVEGGDAPTDGPLVGKCTTRTYDFTATDDCGNTQTATRSTQNCDETDPYFTGDIEDETQGPCALTDLTPPAASDACCGSATVTKTTAPFASSQGADCPSGKVYTWTATDCVGNTVTALQTVSFEDKVKPTFEANYPPTTAPGYCNFPDFTKPKAFDCDSEVAVVGGSPVEEGNSSTKTWTATDNCGNTATISQTVTKEDTVPPTFSSLPADIANDCEFDNGNPSLTASDFCDGTVTVLFTEVRTDGCSQHAYTLVRNWSAEDAAGNEVTHSQTITHTDNKKPTLSAHPDNESHDCSLPNAPTVTGSDNCDGPLNAPMVETTTAGACAGGLTGSTTTRTWTATDSCGQAATHTQVVTVGHSTAWTLSNVPDDATVPCGDKLPEAPVVTAFTHCNAELNVTPDETSATDGCTVTTTRTWSATDACGHTKTGTQVITQEDNEDPKFDTKDQNTSGECPGAAPTKSANATDNCGAATVTSTTSTSGACPTTTTTNFRATDWCGNFADAVATHKSDDTTPPSIVVTKRGSEGGLGCGGAYVAWEADCDDDCDEDCTVTPSMEQSGNNCAGSYTTTLTAVDACGNKQVETFTASWSDNEKPTLADQSDVELECGASPPARPDSGVADNCNKGITAQHSSVANAPTKCATSATHTFTADDACGNTSTSSWTVTYTDSKAPSFASLPGDSAVPCNSEVGAVTLHTDDDCDGAGSVVVTPVCVAACGNTEVCTYTADAADACGNPAATHSWEVKTVDNTAPYFTSNLNDKTIECGGTDTPASPSASDNCGAATVTLKSSTTGAVTTHTYTATDSCGNTATDSYDVTVEDTTPPVCDPLPPLSGGCDATPSFGSPDCDEVCSTTAASFTDLTTDGCGDSFTTVRTWEVCDEANNCAEVAQTFTASDSGKPELTAPKDFAATCTSPYNPAPAASDDCGGATVTETSEVVRPGTCNGLTLYTYTATDECGNTQTSSNSVTTKDEVAPWWTSAAGSDKTVEYPCADGNCDADAQEADDDCHAFTVTENSDASGNTCSSVTVYTFNAVDECGNAADERTQAITVEDTTDPTISLNGPASVTVDHADAGDVAVPTVTCSDANGCTVTRLPDEKTDGNSECVYTVVRKWKAVDICTGEATVSQTIRVTDDSTPVWTGTPSDATVECDAIPGPCDVSAEDSCDGDLEITTSTSSTPGSGQVVKVIVHTFTATDSAGHKITEKQTVTVRDTTAPTLSRLPEDETVDCDCDTFPPMPQIAAMDNCDAGVTVNHSETEQNKSGDNDHEFELVRTWTATDSRGNTVSHKQTVTVTDTTSPVLLRTPADESVSCEDGEPSTANIARDNCDDSVVVQTTSTRTDGKCDDEYTVSTTWSAQDTSGNTVSHTQKVEVKDTSAPRAFNDRELCVGPGTGSAVFSLGDVFDAHDGCSDTVSYTHVACNTTATTGSCSYSNGQFTVASAAEGNAFDYKVYGSFADNCGNSASFVQQIAVRNSYAESAGCRNAN